MVKIAKKEHKRGPLAAIFGLILAVGLFAVSYIISAEYIIRKVVQVRDAVAHFGRPTATLIFAFGIWIVLLAAAFFIVAILVGQDPESAKKDPLPPKKKDMKKRK
jgi:hypothetical protein